MKHAARWRQDNGWHSLCGIKIGVGSDWCSFSMVPYHTITCGECALLWLQEKAEEEARRQA